MKFSANFLIRFILVFAISIQLSGCNDCDQEPYTTNLTVKEKSFIQNRTGDTLHFNDNAGKKYFLICKSSELGEGSFSSLSNKNPCDDRDVRWEKKYARFEGNVLNDQDHPIALQVRIEAGYQPNDNSGAVIDEACNSNQRCFFYLFFSTPQPTATGQTFWGKTDDKLFPAINNFSLKPSIILGGRLFQNINTHCIANTCSANSTTLSGLDSIYYSAQYGLVRFTTVGGKKYQRVL